MQKQRKLVILLTTILNNTKFNGVEVVDSAAAKSVAINYSGDASSVTTTVGPEQA